MKWIIFLPILIPLLPLTDRGKRWETTRTLTCHDSLTLQVVIHQRKNPFRSPPIHRLDFDAKVGVILSSLEPPKGIFEGESSLIYQCALCAPRKLAAGNDTLNFTLSDFFEREEQASGRFYAVFSQLSYGGKTLTEGDSVNLCLLELHELFEIH